MAWSDADTATLDALTAQLAAIDAAILAVLAGSQSYSIDTGQTRQTVTKADIGSLRLLRKEIKDEIAALNAKYTATSFVGRPTW